MVAAITIVGIPWARACFNIGLFVIWPFGREAVNRQSVTGEGDIGTGFLGTIGNVIGFIFAGFWLAIGHLIIAVDFGAAVSASEAPAYISRGLMRWVQAA